MSRSIVFKAEARIEFTGAVGWYEAQRPGLGHEFETEVANLLDKVLEDPQRFRPVTRLVRTACMRRFPYSIYFAEAGDVVGVVAVFHAKRDPAVLYRRLGLEK